jgi:predicted lipoprotein with Yx(FWY)xxD motif
MTLALLLPILLSGADIMTDDPHPAVVTLDGPVATGPLGTPLYTIEGISCGEECKRSWPPLKADANDKPVGDWHPYAEQWTYKRKFVHYFSGDHSATKATGDGIGNVWFVIRHMGRMPRFASPPSARIGKLGSSFYFTDYRGHVLYSFVRDRKTPACKDECLEVWPPLLAPALAQPIGDWVPIDRPDGVRQWSYRGKLLYTYNEDVGPADMNGADAEGLWKPIAVTAKDGARPGAPRSALSGAGSGRPGD